MLRLQEMNSLLGKKGRVPEGVTVNLGGMGRWESAMAGVGLGDGQEQACQLDSCLAGGGHLKDLRRTNQTRFPEGYGCREKEKGNILDLLF